MERCAVRHDSRAYSARSPLGHWRFLVGYWIFSPVFGSSVPVPLFGWGRAIADMVYLNPAVTWQRDGARHLLESLRIRNWMLFETGKARSFASMPSAYTSIAQGLEGSIGWHGCPGTGAPHISVDPCCQCYPWLPPPRVHSPRCALGQRSGEMLPLPSSSP